MTLPVALLIPAFIAAVAAVAARIPGVVNRAAKPAQQGILLACLAMAIAVAVQFNVVNTETNRLAGFNIAWPLQHVMVALSIWFFQIFYIYSIEGDRRRAARSVRRHAVPMAIAVAAMVGLFCATPDALDFVHGPGGRTEKGGPGDPLAAVAFIVFSVYLGWSQFRFMRLDTRWAAKAVAHRLMRAGLYMAAVGSFIGALYCAHKLMFQIALLAKITPAWAEASIGNVLMPISVTLALAGLSTSVLGSSVGSRLGRRIARAISWLGRTLHLTPVGTRTARWWRHYTARLDLYPLWKTMYKAGVAPVLDPPVVERLRLRKANTRLYRRVIEIWDGYRNLNQLVPDYVRQAAEQDADDARLDTDAREAVVCAVMILIGLHIVSTSSPAMSPAASGPMKANSEQLDLDVALWRHVSHAMAHSALVKQIVSRLTDSTTDLDVSSATGPHT